MRKGIITKAIKEAKRINDKQRVRDLILIKFAIGMSIYALIISFTFIFISLIGRLLM